MIKPALAVNDVKISGFKYPGQTIDNNTDIAGLLTGQDVNILELIFFFVGMLFFANILIASYQYITASGNPQAIQAATKRLINSFLGIAVVVTSYLIIKMIGSMMGFGASGINNII